MINIDPGNFDSKVFLYKKSRPGGFLKDSKPKRINELGETEQDLILISSPWCEFEELRGKEKLNLTGTVESKKYAKVVIRFNKDVTQATVLKRGNTTYNITSVVTLGRNKYLELLVEEDKVRK